MPKSFNLLTERWIPVLRVDGRFERVGIQNALAEAHEIRQIAASNPMDNVGLMRFLLAILYWCKGNPPAQAESEGLIETGKFPVKWFAKLDEGREYFELLGEATRFYQYRDQGPTKENTLTANYLLHEVPSGTNAWHFRHSTDRENGLCPACCATGLVRLPLFATSGGRGKPPGINSKPPIYAAPVGVSLLETLILNWCPASNLGTPAWEQLSMQAAFKGNVPLLSGLTWLPRRVWLDDPGLPEGPCIACGSQEARLIRTCVFAGIGTTKSDGEAPARNWVDPHVVYTRDKSGVLISTHASDALGSPDAAANQWSRVLANILAHEPGPPLSLRHAAGTIKGALGELLVSVVGFSTVQNDKYPEAWERHLVVPANALLDGVSPSSSVDKLQRWRKEYPKLLTKLINKLKPPKLKQSARRFPELASALSAIRPHVESLVSGHVTGELANPEESWAKAAEEYGQIMPILARSLAPGFTTRALERQAQIARALPEITTNQNPKASKAKARKGGGK